MLQREAKLDILSMKRLGAQSLRLFFFWYRQFGSVASRKSTGITIQMNSIKAIDTRFRGVLYRSRLEARWSVFFHRLGLDYDYEAEGYQLPSGWYLPDFYIRDWGCFVEVKPRGQLEPDAVVKGFELQQESSKRIIILVGNPYPSEYVALMYPGDALAVGGEFACCSHCNDGMALSSSGCHITLKDNGCFNDIGAQYKITPRLREAYIAARSARFEHGETA